MGKGKNSTSIINGNLLHAMWLAIQKSVEYTGDGMGDRKLGFSIDTVRFFPSKVEDEQYIY